MARLGGFGTEKGGREQSGWETQQQYEMGRSRGCWGQQKVCRQVNGSLS